MKVSNIPIILHLKLIGRQNCHVWKCEKSTLTVTYQGEAGSEQQGEVHGQALDQHEDGSE